MKRTTSNYGVKNGVPAKDIDAYLTTVPQETRVVLERLRKTIKSAAPKAEEVISYQMPAFKYHGVLVFFAAFTNHCSFFVASKAVMKAFCDELKPYHTSGVTIHFSAESPLPATLVKKIVKARVKENELRFKSKTN